MMQHKDIALLFQQLLNLNNNNNRAILKTVITTLLTVKNQAQIEVVTSHHWPRKSGHTYNAWTQIRTDLKAGYKHIQTQVGDRTIGQKKH